MGAEGAVELAERGVSSPTIDEYAAAVAETLDASTGATWLAISGHRGRGKTRLAQQVDAMLAARARTKHVYATVWFRASKHSAMPEVWAHLYETFARAAYERGWWTAVPRAARAKLDRTGVLPIVRSLAIAGLALLPLGLRLNVWLTLSWLCLIIVALFTIRGPVAAMIERAISPVRHIDKLGLEATVERDLRSLVRGWLRRPAKEPWSMGLGSLELVAGSVAGFGLVLWICLTPRFGSWTHVVVVGWLALAAALSVWIWRGGRDVDRLLLIVDDLSRCEAAQVADILASIRLHVEEPALGNSVQVLVLVEEGDRLEELSPAHLRLPPSHGEGLAELSGDDREAVLAVRHLIAKHRPGSMRSFVVRYRLARCLLRHRGADIAPGELARALAEHLAAGGAVSVPVSEELRTVLHEVA